VAIEKLPLDAELPEDLIDLKTAARLARADLSSVHRWVHSDLLRAWKRCGRFFVSRVEVCALFEPVQPQGNRPRKRLRVRERKRSEAWAEVVLDEAGI
jgi:hypothetical protein